MNKKVIIPAAVIGTVLAAGAAAFAYLSYIKGPAEPEAKEEPEAPDEPEKSEEPEEDAPQEQEEGKSEIELDGIDAPDFTEQEETLESYISEHPEEKESLEAVKNSFTADGVTTDISCTGDTMFFDFIMSDVDDDETKAALKPDLESFLEEQSDAYAEIVASIEEETGLEGIKMIVIFMDANEEEIVSGHYDKSGKVL